jgi:hypothetical protein
MTTSFSQSEYWIEKIFHCPFCGYDLGLGKKRKLANG